MSFTFYGADFPIASSGLIIDYRCSVINADSAFYLACGGFTIAALVLFFALASQRGIQISSGFLIRPDIELDRFMADISHHTRLLRCLISALGSSPA
jgi:hypothetical protein